MTTARQAAIAAESKAIDQSQARALAARETESRPRNALEALAKRLDVSPNALKDTLLKTVFKGCSEAEFVSMVVVANTYNLNPMLREIYAFPKKGGGIQAIVGYDGWVKIMNDHPQFDGMEFVHIEDKDGNLKAVEGIIYRKDRTRPIKKMIYLKEFKRNTEPWNNSPHHMLDVRCLCHTVRLAFGVSAGVEGDEELVIDGGTITAQSMPSKKAIAEELGDEIPAFDKKTGEIVDQPAGMTEVDEETDRALDAGDFDLEPEAEPAAEEPSQAEIAAQTVEDIDGPLEEAFEWQDNVDQIKYDASIAQSMDALKAIERDYLQVCASWPKHICDEVEAALTAKRNQLRGEG